MVERRWGRVAIGAAVLAVAAGPAFLFLGRSQPPEPIQILPSSVVRIDPTTQSVIADVPVAEPKNAQIASVPPNEIWVLSQNQQVVSIIDSDTNSLSGGPVPIGRGEAGGSVFTGFGMVYAFGSVWVTPLDDPRSIERIDPVKRTADPKSFRTPGHTGNLASGFGDLWVSVREGNTGHVVAMDPRTGDIRCDGRAGNGSYNVAYGEGAVWLSNHDDFTATRVEPSSCEHHTIPLPGITGEPTGIGFGFGFVWVSDSEAGVVYKIDPATLNVVKSIPVSEPGWGYQTDIVRLGASMWVASPVTNTIERIDPITNEVRDTIQLPYAPQGLVAANGSLWATVTKDPA